MSMLWRAIAKHRDHLVQANVFFLYLVLVPPVLINFVFIFNLLLKPSLT